MASLIDRRNAYTLLWAIVSLTVQGCASAPERNPITEEAYPDALVLGMSGLRYWGDEEMPLGENIPDNITVEELQDILPALVNTEMDFLAISGGGANGAFAAGLLNAWTDSGTRPEFNIVTGISTGALIAPFAYLGPDYDHLLTEFYTKYSTDDLVEERGWLRTILGGEAGYDTEGLQEKLAEYFDEDVMRAIAAEYKRGRILLIGTTNLDASRPVNWNIGAIASSGKPGALQLIRDVILASASIPIAFPPVMIDVVADGVEYDEMHTDGGVSRQSFIFYMASPEDTFEQLGVVGQPDVYIIRNSKLEPTWRQVDRKVLAIGGRSASAMVHTQGIGDLYREFLGARKYGFDFNLAYIPRDFDAQSNELFDVEYMRKLYQLAYDLAINGYDWKEYPPGLSPP